MISLDDQITVKGNLFWAQIQMNNAKRVSISHCITNANNDQCNPCCTNQNAIIRIHEVGKGSAKGSLGTNPLIFCSDLPLFNLWLSLSLTIVERSGINHQRGNRPIADTSIDVQ
jgi:hypothetical protein